MEERPMKTPPSDLMKSFFDEKAESWDLGNDERSDLREKLIRRLPISNGMKIIDIGCGTGVITPLLHSLSNTPVLGVDISPRMIEIAKGKDKENQNEFVCADFCQMNFAYPYDGAIFYNCYPHFMDLDALKLALIQCLKPGGFFAIVHNSGRGELFACHRKHMHVSRNMLPIEKEAEFYLDNFKIEIAEESDDYYLLVLRKNN